MWRTLQEAREEIVRRYGISPSTFHTWISRYRETLEKEGVIKTEQKGLKKEVVEVEIEKFTKFFKEKLEKKEKKSKTDIDKKRFIEMLKETFQIKHLETNRILELSYNSKKVIVAITGACSDLTIIEAIKVHKKIKDKTENFPIVVICFLKSSVASKKMVEYKNELFEIIKPCLKNTFIISYDGNFSNFLKKMKKVLNIQ